MLASLAKIGLTNAVYIAVLTVVFRFATPIFGLGATCLGVWAGLTAMHWVIWRLKNPGVDSG